MSKITNVSILEFVIYLELVPPIGGLNLVLLKLLCSHSITLFNLNYVYNAVDNEYVLSSLQEQDTFWTEYRLKRSCGSSMFSLPHLGSEIQKGTSVFLCQKCFFAKKLFGHASHRRAPALQKLRFFTLRR